MADAKKCDRCGEFYVAKNFRQKLTVRVNSGSNTWYELDLCDKCHKELQAFLNFNNADKEEE